MVEHLALTRVTKIDEISKEVPRPASGLPLNALPGWNRLPLCDKLPMLDAPTNQIIFSRDKIGKKLWKPSEFVLYDPNCYTVKIDYDSLHDPHLKGYYYRPVNLKRIREIGRITDNNDVLCTLKEFNDYRQYLRRLHLDLINEEVKRREMAQRDRFLIKAAEEVAYKQTERLKSNISRTKSEIIQLKQERERQRIERAQQLANNLKRAHEKIKRMKQLQKEAILEKSKMRDHIRGERLKRAHDAEKFRVIALKKQFKMRDMKVKKIKRYRFDEEQDAKLMNAIARWQKRLEFRAWNHQRSKRLRMKDKMMRAESVARHKRLMQMKWDHIQTEIAEKSMQRHKRDLLDELTSKLQRKLFKTKGKSNELKPLEVQLTGGQRDSSSQWKTRVTAVGLKHSQQDMQDALSTAISLHDMPGSNHESTDKIINSAKYILEKVLKTVNRNLGEDVQARDYMYRRIKDLFTRTKKHVLMKVDRVIQGSDGQESQRSSELEPTKSCPISKSIILPLWSKSAVNTNMSKSIVNANMSKVVSFGEIEPIGKTAQEIDSDVELKSVRSRTPTPASSFTSINAVVKETCTEEDVKIPFKTREHSYRIPHWTPNERIFVEHFYIKFKKALLVGVERAVFDSIDLKKREFRLNSRREILELDRDYLTNIMAESILTYNLNSYNYYGNSRLCISVLAAECLFDLQNTSLKAMHDPSYRIDPRCRCNIGTFGKVCMQNKSSWGF